MSRFGQVAGAPRANSGRAVDSAAGSAVVAHVLLIVRLALVAGAIGVGATANLLATTLVLPVALAWLLLGLLPGAGLTNPLIWLWPRDDAPRPAAAGQDGTLGFRREEVLTAGASIVVAAAGTLGAAGLVRAYTGGVDGPLADLGIAFARFTLPQVCLYVVAAILGRALTTRGQSALGAWSAAMGELVSIAGVAFFGLRFQGHVSAAEWTPDMVATLGGSLTAGLFVRTVLLAVAWRRGSGDRVSGATPRGRDSEHPVGVTDPAERKPPAAAASSTRPGRTQALAAALGPQLGYLLASLALWRATGFDEPHAGTAQTVVAGTALFANAVAVVMAMHLVGTRPVVARIHADLHEAAGSLDLAATRSAYGRALAGSAAYTVAVSVALVVFAAPIMGVLFGSSRPGETAAGALVLSCLALVLVPAGVGLINRRTLAALAAADSGARRVPSARTVLPLLAGGCGWLAVLAAPGWIGPALALGAVLAASGDAAASSRLVAAHVRGIDWAGLLRSVGRIVLSAAGAGYLTWGVVMVLTRLLAGWGGAGEALTVLVGAAGFAVAYVLLARWLNAQDVARLVAPIIDLLDRRPAGRHRPGD